jgi:hypothetical protein
MSTVEIVEQSSIPGGMERTLSRVVPDGLIEFEEAPVGYLTKAGEPRKTPWRAYFWTPTDGKRARFPSTTTLLDAICPKPGIPPWSEERGIEGAMAALEQGNLSIASSPAEAIATVRRLKLGADAAKQEAAERGLGVHTPLEEYMRTGVAPSLAGRPEHHHGYIVAMTNWLLTRNPEPVAVEEIVVNPENGYAGRLDLRAMIDGQLVTVDAKTQAKAAIYRQAHWQVGMYERGAVRCGDEPADRKLIVVFAADGKWREMESDLDDWQLDAALAYWRACKPIDSACESANRAERAARA